MKYQKKALPTQVEFAEQAGTLATLEGPVGYKVGDALLTGIAAERWPIERAHFESAYLALPPSRMGEPGLYVKKPATVSAQRLTEATQISIQHGQATLYAQAGDWLVSSEDGKQWIVAHDIFRASYQALEQ